MQDDRIESKITRILQRDVDIVYFNEAPPSLIANILQTGIPLAVRDKKLYLDVLFARIQEFIVEAPPFYEKILEFLEEYLKET